MNCESSEKNCENTLENIMSNYPPGVTAGHPHFNPPDRSHEHRWRSQEKENPLFEDGAAIFLDYCDYSEGRHRDGWSCEETRSLRCELERVVVEKENEPDVTYLAKTEDPENSWSYIERLFEEAIISVEIGTRDDIHLENIYPANEYGDGYVEVSVGDVRVVYSQ